LAESGESVNYSIISLVIDNVSKVLMVPGLHGWSLPCHGNVGINALNEEIRQRFDLQVTTLECAREFSSGPGEACTSRVYVHENLSPSPRLEGGARWMTAGEIAAVNLSVPEHRKVIDTWFMEATAEGVPTQRLPWARVGWFAEASAWSTEQLRNLGRQVIGPVEQVACTPWSALLKFHTHSGDVYFKAASPRFGHEPTLTRLLAKWFPRRVPNVLAVDTERCWMLTEDFGPAAVVAAPDCIAEAYLQILPVYARMQIETTVRTDSLLDAGCPDRRTNLPELYEKILEDRDSLSLGEKDGLTHEEYERLKAYTPTFADLCRRISEFSVPAALVHGDLWRGNFTLRSQNGNGEPILFDWAEASLGHPFFSLTAAKRDIRSVLPAAEAENIVSTVTNAYLAQWGQYEPPQQLNELIDLTAVPAVVNRTVEWWTGTAALEPERALSYRYAVPINLRRLLSLTQSNGRSHSK
jgi:hypothetical protein